MALLEVTLKLPEELVRDAYEFDLLTDTAIAELIRAELDQRINDLVNSEIHAYRREKAQQQKNQKSE